MSKCLECGREATVDNYRLCFECFLETSGLEEEYPCFSEQEDYMEEDYKEEPYGGAFSSWEDYYNYRGIKVDY